MVHESEPYGTADGVKDSAECTVHGGQTLQLQYGYDSSKSRHWTRAKVLWKHQGDTREIIILAARLKTDEDHSETQPGAAHPGVLSIPLPCCCMDVKGQ